MANSHHHLTRRQEIDLMFFALICQLDGTNNVDDRNERKNYIIDLARERVELVQRNF